LQEISTRVSAVEIMRY